MTFLFIRDFFRAVSPRRIAKPLLTYNCFWSQTANAAKDSMCSPLQVSYLVLDEAQGSSAAHPSLSCYLQPNTPFSFRASQPNTVLRAQGFATFCKPALFLGLRVLQHSFQGFGFCNPTLLLALGLRNPTRFLGLRVLQPNTPFRDQGLATQHSF